MNGVLDQSGARLVVGGCLGGQRGALRAVVDYVVLTYCRLIVLC